MSRSEAGGVSFVLVGEITCAVIRMVVRYSTLLPWSTRPAMCPAPWWAFVVRLPETDRPPSSWKNPEPLPPSFAPGSPSVRPSLKDGGTSDIAPLFVWASVHVRKRQLYSLMGS